MKMVPLCLLLAACVEPTDDTHVDDGRCFITIDQRQIVSQVQVDAACSPGETRSLLLTVKDGDSALSTSMIRFPCGSVRLITQVAAPQADLIVDAFLRRDDGTRVDCNWVTSTPPSS